MDGNAHTVFRDQEDPPRGSRFAGNSSVPIRRGKLRGKNPAPDTVALRLACDHAGDHMKVVSVRDFRDRASEMFRSEDVILVTRDGAPAGFFLPWETPELPVEVRREVFLRLSAQIGTELQADGVSEHEVLDDFAADRRRR